MRGHVVLQTEPKNALLAPVARHLLKAQRLLLGLVLVGFGVSGLLNLLPSSAAPASAEVLGTALVHAGFAYPLLKGIQVLLELYLASLDPALAAGAPIREESVRAPRLRQAFDDQRVPHAATSARVPRVRTRPRTCRPSGLSAESLPARTARVITARVSGNTGGHEDSARRWCLRTAAPARGLQ